jgi:hypothetical protein
VGKRVRRGARWITIRDARLSGIGGGASLSRSGSTGQRAGSCIWSAPPVRSGDPTALCA